MYFLFNKPFNAFYGNAGVWIPKDEAKKSPGKLCVFGDLYEAQLCKSREGFKGSVTILNEKSMKNRLKIKQFPSVITPNWSENKAFVPAKKQDREQPKIQAPVNDDLFCPDFMDDNLFEDCFPCVKEDEILKGITEPVSSKNDTSQEQKKKMTYCEYLESLDENTITESGDRMYLQGSIPPEVLSTKLIQNTLDFLSQSRSILTEWESRMKAIDTEIRRCDLQTSDELHFLELIDNLPDADLLSCSKRLQEIRRTRRIAKNERDIGQLVIPMIRSGIDINKLEAVEKFIHDTQSKVYRVRQPNTEIELIENSDNKRNLFY